MKKVIILIVLLFELCFGNLSAQPFPSADEKIPFLCTFSKNSQKDWGDDDFVQIYFFVVPQTEKNPIYIRVFDPDIGGKYDEVHDEFNSKTKFSVYGGKGAVSNPDAKKQTPTGNFKSGIQLSSKAFGDDPTYDDKWYTLGPFNPVEGELQPEGYVFKLIIEGMDGDDGNLYKMFLSALPNENKAIEGGNAFTYEYSFRMADSKGSISHLYPFVAKGITAVKISVFDFDDDGILRVVSVAKKGEITKSSGNAVWLDNTHKISAEELNTSLDIQFVKQQDSKNNNVVVYITNQYGELMPFYATPIGGVPKYKFKIGVKVDN
ncbi:MAG TPA: hypothetical protein VN698_00690 [Bacteroidia bacterium]|nr:hypothetical protein [Bacteroidia bacterium]